MTPQDIATVDQIKAALSIQIDALAHAYKATAGDHGSAVAYTSTVLAIREDYSPEDMSALLGVAISRLAEGGVA